MSTFRNENRACDRGILYETSSLLICCRQIERKGYIVFKGGDKRKRVIIQKRLSRICATKEASRAVAGTVKDAEVGAPRANCIAVLMSEKARDLVQMRKVVNGPRGQ